MARLRRFSFPKEERLCHKQGFGYIFEHGTSLRVGVLKFFYVLNPPEAISTLPLKVAFAVPKRTFKRAVDRNLLKRRLREAYRLNKHLLLPQLQRNEQTLVLLIKYQPRHEHSFDRIQSALVQGLHRLSQTI